MKRAFVVWRRIERRFSETSFKRLKLENIMKRHLIPTLAAAVLGLLASSGFAPAQAYTITDLGADTTPYAVNDAGQVADAVNYPAVLVNRTTTIPAYSRGFIWNNGARTVFGTLGGPGSTARAINIHGQVAGYADTSSVSGSARACLWDATGIHNLNLIAGPNGITAASLGWVLTTAYGINDHGQIVGRGVKTGETSTTDAYLWERDAAGNVAVQRVNLGIPQSGDAETRGINNAGQVVGSVPYVVSGLTWPYASLWQRDLNGIGYNVPLGLLGGPASQAYSINNYGEVVGYALLANGRPNAFYWSDVNGNGVSDSGEMVSLGTLGGLHSVAFTINDAGQVVGWAFDAAGAYRAFVWDAVNGMRDLNALSNVGSTWLLKEARAIDNPGRIVGNGSFTVITVGRGNKVTYSTQNHGFLLTP